MIPIVTPGIESYLHGICPPREPVLAAMEAQAKETGFPIVGPLVGRLLFLLARSLQAESVFELGSGFGYSALWFAMGMAPAGRIVLTDGRAENLKAARHSFSEAGLVDRAVFERGNALDVIERYPGPFDIIFCDIDKHDYPRALEVSVPRLRQGGLLITDNVLWSGRVAGPAAEGDDATAAVQEHNRRLMASRQLVASILPLRDGVAVAVKL